MRSLYLLVLVFVLASPDCMAAVYGRTIKAPTQVFSVGTLFVEIVSIDVKKQWDDYMELTLSVENKGTEPVIIALADMVLVDASGNKAVPIDSWLALSDTEYTGTYNSFAYFSTVGFYLNPKGPEHYTPRERELYDRYQSRLKEDLIVLPNAKNTVLVYFPNVVNLYQAKRLHLKDVMSGKTLEIPMEGT